VGMTQENCLNYAMQNANFSPLLEKENRLLEFCLCDESHLFVSASAGGDSPLDPPLALDII